MLCGTVLVYFGSMTVQDRVLLLVDEAIAVVEYEDDGMSTRNHEVVQRSDGQTVIRLSGTMQGLLGTALLAGLASVGGMIFSVPALDTRLARAEEVNEEQLVEAEAQETRVRDLEESIRRIDGNMSSLHTDFAEIKKLLIARSKE